MTTIIMYDGDENPFKKLGEQIHNLKEELNLIINQNQKIMATLADIQTQNQALIEAVAAEDTVIESAVTLITGFGATLTALQKQLADAIAANDPVATQAVVDSLGSSIADINAKKQALADAVVAGTPAQ